MDADLGQENILTIPRAIGAFIANCLISLPLIIILSGYLMDFAAYLLDEKVAWPQIAFMSTYPSDVRNGYVLFVASVAVTVILFSGIIGGLIGASPGKALFGVRYKTINEERSFFLAMVVRSLLIVATLLPMFLAGPALGFIFGPSADPFSLLALGVGFLIVIFSRVHHDLHLSWIDRTAGVKPSFDP